MLTKQNKNDVNFEGKGTLVIKYQKYTTEMGERIMSNMGTAVGKFKGNIKEFLLKNGALTKEGDLLNLPPRHVEILDGTGTFDESLINGSKFIIQKGGELEKKITGEHIVFRNGTNVGAEGNMVVLRDTQQSGDIKAGSLIIENTSITSKKINAGHTSITNSDNLNPSLIPQPLLINGNVDLQGNSTLHSASINGNVWLYDNADIHDSIILKSLEADGHSKVLKTSITGNATAKGHSQVLNSSIGENFFAEGNSVSANISVGEDLSIRNDASVDKAIVFKRAIINDNSTFNNSSVKEGLSGYQNAKMKNIEVDDSSSLYGESSFSEGKVHGNLNLGYSAKASDTEVIGTINVYGESDNVKLTNIKGTYLDIFGKATLDGNIEGKFKSLSQKSQLTPEVKLNEEARKSLPVNNWNTFKVKYGKANRMSV